MRQAHGYFFHHDVLGHLALALPQLVGVSAVPICTGESGQPVREYAHQHSRDDDVEDQMDARRLFLQNEEQEQDRGQTARAEPSQEEMRRRFESSPDQAE